MTMHALCVKNDGGFARFSIECPYPDDDTEKPCATFEEHRWPDSNSCRCTALECSCREGDHYGCVQIDGYIESLGPKCRTIPSGQCWYAHAMNEVGLELFGDFELSPALVKLTGCSWEDPIDVEPVVAERVGGVQWCVTHCGLNDETGENHTVRVLVAGAAEGEFDEIVFEDCCDQAAVDENGTFVPCDLRDLVALPKSVAP